jgi:hypothetical protein
MVNSNNKGKRGELKWRDECIKHGFPARRTQQYSGITGDAADVTCPSLDMFHHEVKWVEKLNLNKAVNKAIEECGDKMPIIAHRRNRSPWLVTMLADDWFKLVEKYISY